MTSFFYELFKEEKGTAVIELAIVIPLILTLVFGYIFFMNGIKDTIVMRTAAREGARLFASPLNDGNDNPIEMKDMAIAKAYSELSKSNIKGASVKAITDKEKRYIIVEKPFITRLPKINLKLRAGAVFYCEPVDVIVEE